MTKEEQFVLDLRAKKIEQLNHRIDQRDIAINKLQAEILNLRDENSQLSDELVKNDRIIQNQKYQLGKFAEEMERMQEEITALKYFAKRYLEV
jgi:predicted  nucleic acid-binding Zn-ribbon protein